MEKKTVSEQDALKILELTWDWFDDWFDENGNIKPEITGETEGE